MADGIVFTDCAIWYDGEDLTTQSNEVSASFTRDALDRSAFGSSWKARKAGAASGQASAKCFWIADPVDDQQWPEVGGAGVLTLAEANTAGEDAWMMQTAGLEYGQGGRYGELMMASPRWGVDGVAAKGVVAVPKSARSTTGNGSVVGLGSVTAGQEIIVATLHVFAVTGTLTVKIQSDSASNFPSPTDVITQSATTVGAYYLTHSSAVTDTWWRASWSAITTATFCVSFARVSLF